jgi:hypothetical protein
MTYNLYLIYDPLTGLHKIGITGQGVLKRINNLKRKYHHGDQLELVHTVSSDDAECIELMEEQLHMEYADVQRKRKTWIVTEDSQGEEHKREVNLNGYTEWFFLTMTDVFDVKASMNGML